jgi:hypothetical protein
MHLLAEQIPAGMPDILHADIDDHEWFVQQPVFDHPTGEGRPIVMIEIQSIAPRSPISSRPPAAARQQRTKTTHCPDCRKQACTLVLRPCGCFDDLRVKRHASKKMCEHLQSWYVQQATKEMTDESLGVEADHPIGGRTASGSHPLLDGGSNGTRRTG